MSHDVQILGTRAQALRAPIEALGCRAEVIAKPDQIRSDADICLAAGVHYLIDEQYLEIPRLGLWGFHESALPEGRGCAPIHWSVLHGKTELTVSFFKLVKKMDAGDLLGQRSAPITQTMLLADLRAVAMELIEDLLNDCLLPYLDGTIEPYAQTGEPTFYRRRTPRDGKLDLDATLRESWDLIRTCDPDAYPAWFEIDGTRFELRVRKASSDA